MPAWLVREGWPWGSSRVVFCGPQHASEPPLNKPQMSHREAFRELELTEGLPLAEVKAQYRRLAKLWHPDKNKTPGASARMVRINLAYEVLCQFYSTPFTGHTTHDSGQGFGEGGSVVTAGDTTATRSTMPTPSWVQARQRRAAVCQAGPNRHPKNQNHSPRGGVWMQTDCAGRGHRSVRAMRRRGKQRSPADVRRMWWAWQAFRWFPQQVQNDRCEVQQVRGNWV